jgi:hypothetical protein
MPQIVDGILKDQTPTQICSRPSHSSSTRSSPSRSKRHGVGCTIGELKPLPPIETPPWSMLPTDRRHYHGAAPTDKRGRRRSSTRWRRRFRRPARSCVLSSASGYGRELELRKRRRGWSHLRISWRAYSQSDNEQLASRETVGGNGQTADQRCRQRIVIDVLADGQPFDWPSLRGKVVLIDFGRPHNPPV